MNRVLIAVDNTKISKTVITTLINSTYNVKEVILLHVERLGGMSLMFDMLGQAELATFKESLKDTDHKRSLDKKAEMIIDHYKKELNKQGYSRITTIIKSGHPAEEILKFADDAGADLILLGYVSLSGLGRLLSGSIASDVQKQAKVPVIIAKKPATCEEQYSWKDAYAAVTLTTLLVIAMFLIGTVL
jgi:nucleotide-binding universal stress UspA family protein